MFRFLAIFTTIVGAGFLAHLHYGLLFPVEQHPGMYILLIVTIGVCVWAFEATNTAWKRFEASQRVTKRMHLRQLEQFKRQL